MDKQESRLEEQDKRISLLENYVVDMHRDIQFLSDFVRTYVNDSSAEVSSGPSGEKLKIFFIFDIPIFASLIMILISCSNQQKECLTHPSNQRFSDSLTDFLLLIPHFQCFLIKPARLLPQDFNRTTISSKKFLAHGTFSTPTVSRANSTSPRLVS